MTEVKRNPLACLRRALEFIAPVSHRPERIDVLERAVRVVRAPARREVGIDLRAKGD